MENTIYHIYKRSISKGGKKITAYYYWYYDDKGKQVRKSCGQHGKMCLTKREALEYIASLPSERPEVYAQSLCTFSDCVSGMFNPDSLYLKKRTAKGYSITEYSRQQKEHHLKVFLDKYGDRNPKTLDIPEIEDWLLSWDRSNSWRNAMLQITKEIYTEVYNQKKIDRIPIIEGFKRVKKSNKGILSTDEIKALYPADFNACIDLWRRIPTESVHSAYVLCVMTYTILTSGMRSGEARALQYSQFIAPDTILLNASFSDGERTDHLKKATADNKKWRVAILPDSAVMMLDKLKKVEDTYENQTEYVFEKAGKPIRKEHLNERFQWVLQKLGIDFRERKLSIHSLRFTYNTMMKSEISGEDLRAMMGHTAETMTDYYDRSTAIDKLPALQKNKETINSVFTLPSTGI